LRRLLDASWADRAMLAEAGICLALARVAVLVLPFRLIAARLGAHMEESDATDDPLSVELGRRIGWAIGALSKHVPWRTKCLEQALAAKAMLRRRRISNTMYLGVARGEHERSPLGAHAWLRTGTLHVTGGSRVGHYKVLSTFADTGSHRPRSPSST
jgi:hypothetical protein